MEILDAPATHALLPYPTLADSLVAVLRALRRGSTYAPPRQAVPLPDGAILLLMSATDGELAITKLVTVHPRNAIHSLPSIQAEVLVLEARTGRRLLLLEGAAVTARRTAALSLLAARRLAPVPTGPLLVVGAGVQARAHLEALTEGLGVRDVYIAARTPAHAAALVALARQRGLTAQVVAAPEEALDRATLIVTATTSRTPVLPDRVRDDALVIAVGAYQPDMAELPPALVRRARLFVDTLESAQTEAGDLIQAGVDWSAVTPLEQVLDDPHPDHGPVVFKSVGHALWDLAAARLAWRSHKVRR
jgi:ornithine cyclodeaminase